MERCLLLDVVTGQSPTIRKLLASQNQSLLIGRDSFLVVDVCLDIVSGVGRFDVQGDRLACERIDE